MMIDFSIEPDFQSKLDWMLDFVKRECEPLDLLLPKHGDRARLATGNIQLTVAAIGIGLEDP